MAKYSTTEEIYQCQQCATRFALREAKQIGTNPQSPIYECPGCEDTFLMFVLYGDKFVDKPYRMWGSLSGRTELMNFDPVHIEHD